jgi:hypothetical protein
MPFCTRLCAKLESSSARGRVNVHARVKPPIVRAAEYIASGVQAFTYLYSRIFALLADASAL